MRGLGYLALMPALTLLVYYLWIGVEFHHGQLVLPTIEDLEHISGPTVESVGILGCWLLLQGSLYLWLPGKKETAGDGRLLEYPLNGWTSLCISLGLFYLAATWDWIPATVLHDQFGPLLTTTNIFAYALSLVLYFSGGQSAQTKHSASPVGDYFLGTSLNPRLGRFDLKFFFEGRPGLIGWVLIDLSLAYQQQQEQGAITTPMYLVLAFQVLYVADYFWHEEAILNTWDIRHENFGWMLVWGDIVWVPFTYTLQAHYLVRHSHELPWWGTAGIVTLNMLGYIVFRGANWQKHQFRKDPHASIWGKPPQYIRTVQGGLLLVSGWWGMARHVNYLGDLMMALAWCLPCLFDSPLPYFYFVYFLILLIHRERRDNWACHEKYGPDWDEYCRRVPWRIVPHVY